MAEISGKTRVCGIIANPVEHSLSPVLHNTLAEKMNHAVTYVPFKPEKQGLRAAVEGAYALHILGMNVSVPYKQEVMGFLVTIDKAAKEIGAVNTLVRVEGGYKGYNTDILGLKKAMELEGIVLSNEEVIILGAGGVSKAAAYLCCQQEAKKVYLLNRTIENAKKLAEEVNSFFNADTIVPLRLEEFGSIPSIDTGYLAIQTTNVGMYPNVEEAVIEDAAFYKKLHTAYDLIYTPFETRFMSLAKREGAKAYNGLPMLLYQGVAAYELWNETAVPEEIAKHCYERMKKELGQ